MLTRVTYIGFKKESIARGVKHLFIVRFDGLDWPTTQASHYFFRSRALFLGRTRPKIGATRFELATARSQST